MGGYLNSQYVHGVSVVVFGSKEILNPFFLK